MHKKEVIQKVSGFEGGLSIGFSFVLSTDQRVVFTYFVRPSFMVLSIKLDILKKKKNVSVKIMKNIWLDMFLFLWILVLGLQN